MTTRRAFLDQLAVGAVGTAALGALPLALGAASPHRGTSPAPSGAWNVSWPRRITGKHRVVLDVPEVDSGYGVWRASIWAQQYAEVLATPERELSTVLVLRHNGVVLGMRQAFWDEYGIGKKKSATHPVTLEPTDRNPALLSSSRGEVPAQFDGWALDRLIARGAVVLACNLALADCVQLVQTKTGLNPEAAREKALGYLVPGVIMQPSGVFAALRAQEVGCNYLRAS
jgi:hypothetical protein